MKRCALLCILLVPTLATAEPIRLANNPALSADGQWLAFDWNGDIWIVASTGGEARQLTSNPARDTQPKFAPDGKSIAFVSDREGSPAVYTVPFHGGVPKQLTFHTAGTTVQEWSADGNGLLIKATRDHFWRHGERFFTIKSKERSAEQLLFDDYGSDGTLSPDGKKLLFTREGGAWWRKGYTGAGAAQVWLYDFEAKTFHELLHDKFGCRWPMWMPDGKGFYYVEEHAKGSKIRAYHFEGLSGAVLTSFKEDSVVFPTIARDGSRIVFRHLFDLYGLDLKTKQVKKLDIYHNVDRAVKKSEYRVLNTATAAAFAPDGLEIAFIAGGDLWVMDTELREPRQVTRTPSEESSPIFSADGQTIYVVSSIGSHFEISKVTRKNPKQFWWQNREFEVVIQLGFQERPTKLKLSPDGKKLAFVRGVKGLYYLDFANGEINVVLYDWSIGDFDWSPDGKWIVLSKQDEDFNHDIWIVRADGTGKPFNVSRHPYADYAPVWSPDGKMIAFAGRRASGEPGANVSIVALQSGDDEITARDRKLDKALDKMKSRPKPDDLDPTMLEKSTGVVIDFNRLHERVKRVNLGEGSANTLFWSPDSKKLAFTGTFEAKPGTYTIDIGDALTPKLLTPTVGSNPTWLKKGNQILWLVNGVPTSTPGIASAAPADPMPAPTAPKNGFGGKGKLPATGGALATGGGGYTFSVRQLVDLPGRNAAVFDSCWITMRDHWYDGKLGNNDWDKVRSKYRDMAAKSPDNESLQVVVQMMLGELNGSHLGFTMNPGEVKPTGPRDTTAHLGVRFDHRHAGPGLKVRDVLPGSPADKKRSRLTVGDVIHKIDGVEVDGTMDLTLALNGPSDREVVLDVQGKDGKKREVALRPTSYPAAQALLYDHWLHHNRRLVADGSKGKFGYLHISAMSMPNFRKFEEELVSQGAGMDGLVIDVRENPGGSITDHLLTALTQPNHAITVPRGGGPGYPLDRKVYISWHKPIVVLCNQNSGSNAEIFSHAIKTLKRGQVVGVPTAGAVVSTGAASIMDVGTLRLPTRGWFTINDGEDMEKHGAEPHHVLWLQPSQLPQGRDAQLTKALEVLQADVTAWKARPQPKLKLSTDRP
ncbi:MAG: PD40 domain-containing protein [Planctomycetes bacterium]|nr:PD40 domain-containing protein [Planctomycetota bacterium]